MVNEKNGHGQYLCESLIDCKKIQEPHFRMADVEVSLFLDPKKISKND